MIEHVFSEATKMIEPETVHECPLDCPYKKDFFSVNWKSKMATNAGIEPWENE